MTPKERAEKSAAVMWENDKASVWLGMELLDVDEGRATLSMLVQKHHTNGHGICHGGITFALADSVRSRLPVTAAIRPSLRSTMSSATSRRQRLTRC